MLRIGLATFTGLPALTADDKLLAEELRGRDACVEALMWDDPGVRWAELDALVLRSCRDYHRRPAEFLAWVERLERVDGIDRGGVLTLFELELIEPVLFLGMDVRAARRLADAVLAAGRGRTRSDRGSIIPPDRRLLRTKPVADAADRRTERQRRSEVGHVRLDQLELKRGPKVLVAVRPYGCDQLVDPPLASLWGLRSVDGGQVLALEAEGQAVEG